MGISVDDSRDVYNGDGVTTDFIANFRIYKTSDILVQIDDIDKSLGVDYSITIGSGESSTISFNTAPMDETKVALVKNIPYKQPVAFDKGPLDNQDLELVMDRLTSLIQQVKHITRHSPKFKAASNSLDSVLAEPEDGKYLSWDANGNIVNKKSVTTLEDLEISPLSVAKKTIISNSMAPKDITGYLFDPDDVVWVHIEFFVTRNNGAVLGSGILDLHYDGTDWLLVKGPFRTASGLPYTHGLLFSMDGNQFQVEDDDLSGNGFLITKYHAA